MRHYTSIKRLVENSWKIYRKKWRWNNTITGNLSAEVCAAKIEEVHNDQQDSIESLINFIEDLRKGQWQVRAQELNWQAFLAVSWLMFKAWDIAV